MSRAGSKRGAVTRRQALDYVLDAPRRRAYLAYAGSLGASGADAERTVDDAVVAVFGAGLPGDLVMADTLVRLEIARLLGAPPPKKESPARPPVPAERRASVLGGRIRRRRALRLAAVGGAATLAVALTVGAAVAVGQIERAPAGALPEQPGPSDPASSPSASDEPQPLGDVTEHSLLPDAEPLLEGMLEAAGPGWSLVQYSTEALDGGSLVYLVDPEGALYEVPDSEELPGRLAGWLPGSTLAMFSTGRYAGESTVVDLVTRQRYVTVHESLAEDRDAFGDVAFIGDGTTDLVARWAKWDDGGVRRQVVSTVRLGLDGAERGSVPTYTEAGDATPGIVLSPDGTRMAVGDRAGLRVVATDGLTDAGTLRSPYRDGDRCGVGEWLTDELVTLACRSHEGEGNVDELWLAPADGGEATFLGDVMWPDAWLVGGMTVVRTYDDDGPVLYRARGEGNLTRLDAELPWVVSGSAGGRVFGHSPQYEARYWDDELVSVDPFTGDRRVLLTSNHEHSAIDAVVTINDSGRATRGDS